MGIFQRLHLFPQDEGDSEIVFLEARPEANRDQVAGRAAIRLVVVIICFSRQAFLNQLVIEALERRMLHDRKNVDHVGGCLSTANELAVLPLYVVVFIAAPHQTQAAPDRLFKQDAGARCAQRDNDADVVHVEAFAQHEHAHDDARGFVTVHVEQAFAQHLPFVGLQLALAVGIDAQHFVVGQPFELHEISDERRNRGVFADHQHFRMLVRIEGGEIGFQLPELGQAGAQHDALPFRQHRVAVFIPVGFKIQFLMAQRPDFRAFVENKGFDQAGAHGRFQVEINGNMREIGFPAIPSGPDLVIGRGRKVHLDEAAALGFRDQVEALLPFNLRYLAFPFELVDMVRLVVEDHERGQVFQVGEDAAALIATVQHIQIVALAGAGRQGKDALHNGFRIGGFPRRGDFLILKRLAFF